MRARELQSRRHHVTIARAPSSTMPSVHDALPSREPVLNDQSKSPALKAAEGARWSDPFRNGLALYTIMLNVGIGLHALDVFIISTVMPRVVHDLGGAKYYTWATMLY